MSHVLHTWLHSSRSTRSTAHMCDTKLAEHVFHAVGPCTVAAAPSLANRYLLPRPTLRIFTRFWGERLKDVSGSHVVNSLTVRLRNTMSFFELIQSTRSCFVEASSVIRGSPQHFRSLYFKIKVSKGKSSVWTLLRAKSYKTFPLTMF